MRVSPLSYVHVYRNRAQSRLPTGDPVARELSGRREDTEAHAAQPQPLAGRARRRAARRPQGRGRAAAGRAALRRRALAAARGCRRRAGRDARYRPRHNHRTQASARVRSRELSAGRPRPGHDRQPHHRPGVETRHRQGARSRHRRIQPRRRAGPRRRPRGRTLRRARLAPRASGRDRDRAREAPSEGRDAGALRRLVELCRRPLLPSGQTRLQPRRQEGQAADRLRPSLRARRLPRRHRGVRGKHRRSRDPGRSGRQAQVAASPSTTSCWLATAA